MYVCMCSPNTTLELSKQMVRASSESEIIWSGYGLVRLFNESIKLQVTAQAYMNRPKSCISEPPIYSSS